MTSIGPSRMARRPGDLRDEVKHILDLVGLSQHIPDLCNIAERLVAEDLSSIKDLTVIDRTIPGLGFEDINERNPSGSYTGIYQTSDRPIFRGIQYVGMNLRMVPDKVAKSED